MEKNKMRKEENQPKVYKEPTSAEIGSRREIIKRSPSRDLKELTLGVKETFLEFFELKDYLVDVSAEQELYLKQKLIKVGFDKTNLDFLKSCLVRATELEFEFYFNATGKGRYLSFSSSGQFGKFSLSGNISIEVMSSGLAFDLSDFGLWWTPSETDSFFEFYDIYLKIIKGMETYAQRLGFSEIIFNVVNYRDPQTEVVLHPMYLPKYDLKYFINRRDYSLRDNETLKRSILLERGYELFVMSQAHRDVQKIREEKINHFKKRKTRMSTAYKESVRISNTEQLKFYDRYFYNKYVKSFETELIIEKWYDDI